MSDPYENRLDEISMENREDNSIAYIQSLDLEYLMKRVVKQFDWDIFDAKEAIRKYKNFLILHLLHPCFKVVPTNIIDVVWHQHILHTQKYMEDCKQAFGEYFHHNPTDPAETEVDDSYYIMTARLYERHFQEPYGQAFDVTIWIDK